METSSKHSPQFERNKTMMITQMSTDPVEIEQTINGEREHDLNSEADLISDKLANDLKPIHARKVTLNLNNQGRSPILSNMGTIGVATKLRQTRIAD